MTSAVHSKNDGSALPEPSAIPPFLLQAKQSSTDEQDLGASTRAFFQHPNLVCQPATLFAQVEGARCMHAVFPQTKLPRVSPKLLRHRREMHPPHLPRSGSSSLTICQ